MDLKAITIQDCLDMYESKCQVFIINDGKVVGLCDRGIKNIIRPQIGAGIDRLERDISMLTIRNL